ncbi:unnamed protein product, partial [Heterotrigona itama]
FSTVPSNSYGERLLTRGTSDKPGDKQLRAGAKESGQERAEIVKFFERMSFHSVEGLLRESGGRIPFGNYQQQSTELPSRSVNPIRGHSVRSLATTSRSIWKEETRRRMVFRFVIEPLGQPGAGRGWGWSWSNSSTEEKLLARFQRVGHGSELISSDNVSEKDRYEAHNEIVPAYNADGCSRR